MNMRDNLINSGMQITGLYNDPKTPVDYFEGLLFGINEQARDRDIRIYNFLFNGSQ